MKNKTNKKINKFFLKSKVFWVNFVTLIFAVLPELLSYMISNQEFSSMLKEYSTPAYMALFSINAFINISLRFKTSEKLTIKKLKSEEDVSEV